MSTTWAWLAWTALILGVVLAVAGTLTDRHWPLELGVWLGLVGGFALVLDGHLIPL